MLKITCRGLIHVTFLFLRMILCRGLIYQAHLFLNPCIDTYCLEAEFVSRRGLIYQILCYKLSIGKDEEEEI
jgi:hypothetical protein